MRIIPLNNHLSVKVGAATSCCGALVALIFVPRWIAKRTEEARPAPESEAVPVALRYRLSGITKT